MWEIESYDWNGFAAYLSTERVPELLLVVLHSEDKDEWSAALDYLETAACDLGVPCSMTPAVVSCLVSITLRICGEKRTEVLSLLEELTCGRGEELYSSDQQRWRAEAVSEIILGLKQWVALLESSTFEDARQCVGMLAYCAEQMPTLSVRVHRYLELCVARYPELREETQVVSQYFGR